MPKQNQRLLAQLPSIGHDCQKCRRVAALIFHQKIRAQVFVVFQYQAYGRSNRLRGSRTS